MSPSPSSRSRTVPGRSAWFGLAVREPTSRGSIRIRLRWGRISILFVTLGLFLWLGKSFALFHFFKEVRGFDDVRFVDMILFPANRANVRLQQGNYQVDQGMAALEREDYRRAYSLLREGVARAPDNVEGRLTLARMYTGWRPDLATSLMLDGVVHGKEDPAYVRLLSQLLLDQKKDDQILETTASLLLEDLPDEVRRILMASRVQAAIHRGRFSLVRDLYENTDIGGTLDGLVLGTRLYERVGRTGEAIEVLLSVIQSFPEVELDPVYEQLVSFYRKDGQLEEARETALELVIRNPLEWRHRILLIDILSDSGMTDRRDREIEALLSEHRGNEDSMLALARLCAGYGNTTAASRLYEIALENGYDLGLFTLSLAEAYVTGGQSELAVNLCDELVREDPTWLLTAESTFNAIRSLAYFTSGNAELGNLYLNNFISSRRTTVPQLFHVSRSFRENGLELEAFRILQEAHERKPEDEQILVSLIQMEMHLGSFFALDDHLVHLFSLRRPDYSLLEDIYLQLQTDRFLFTENRVALLEELSEILAEPGSLDWAIWQRRASGDPA
ncbi:MAG TPA: tetratricopeptide repeat protein [Oceanipulchritudo sp.]|nr:tetratricopeptide repeat protein [Oceanipulchritudo sp.]